MESNNWVELCPGTFPASYMQRLATISFPGYLDSGLSTFRNIQSPFPNRKAACAGPPRSTEICTSLHCDSERSFPPRLAVIALHQGPAIRLVQFALVLSECPDGREQSDMLFGTRPYLF